MTAGRTVRSASSEWGTPRKIVQAVHALFDGPPDLDPCSGPESIVQARLSFALPHVDGLAEPWAAATIYCNPPYGRDYDRGTSIRDWVRRCAEAGASGSEVVALIPVAPNTTHWKLHVFPRATSICFVADPRLRFRVGGDENNKGAPMALAAVYWGNRFREFEQVFSGLGYPVRTSRAFSCTHTSACLDTP